jgi:hypothetical protein
MMSCFGRPFTLLLIGTIAATAATSSDAQGIKDLTNIVFLNGQCTELRIGSKDARSGCTGKIFNTIYRTGRTGFTFMMGEQAVVTFSGFGKPAVGNRGFSTLDRVLLKWTGSEGEREALLATGTCSFTNPYAGPSHIKCKAFTKRGTISASFVSDGKEPEIESFE